MFPIFVVLASVFIGGAAVGIVTSLAIDAVERAWKGKSLAVLGARGTGKTTLLRFLESGSIPTNYKQTIAPEKISSNKIQLKELSLILRETFDLSGDKAAYGEWKQLYDKADIVLYLLRADRIMSGDKEMESRVLNDMRHIGAWQKERAKRPQVFIIGTHCDLDAVYVRAASNNRPADYEDSFRKLPIVRELIANCGGDQDAKILLGSLKTPQETEKLVYVLISQVTNG